MSRNGEQALRKIIIAYCPRNGSVGTRQFLATYLPGFKADHPRVQIDLRPRLWSRPSITGVYKDGSERAFEVAASSPMAIEMKCRRLVTDANDLNVPFNLGTMHMQRRTVQGAWNPWLWRGDAPKPRKLVPEWDRKLGEKEWGHYVKQYSKRVAAEESAIQKGVDSRTELHNEYTSEVQNRWMEHVAPRMQTDLQSNLAKMKADAAAGVKPEKVTLEEYRLFSVPDHKELGFAGMAAIRGREVQQKYRWWHERKEQLKSPM